jgi:hypothetical protein
MESAIPVILHPFRQSFDSIEEAVKHSMSHPKRFEAKRDSLRLVYSRLADCDWSLSEWKLGFSNGLCLLVFVTNTTVGWQLIENVGGPTQVGSQPPCSAPVRLRWPEPLGVQEMDCSAMINKRREALFRNLHVNHTGFYVYFEKHLVLEFHAVYRPDTGEDMLYVCESD